MCNNYLIAPGALVLPGYEIGTILHLLVFSLVCAHCLRQTREPRSTLLWLFVAWSLPGVGALLYAAFGINRVYEKGWHKQRSDQEFRTARNRREEDAQPLAYWRAIRAALLAQPEPTADALNQILDRIAPDHPLLGGNRARLLPEGPVALKAMFDAVRTARHHVHVQSYIIGHDAVGIALLDLLAEQARRGVTVRVLYDCFGSASARLHGQFRHYARIPNLHLAGFTQANPIKRQFQINLRNHRKILVVDGRLGFTGGMNFHAGYDPADGHPPLHDYHFEVEGPAVLELQYTFLRDWFFMSDENPANLLVPAHFPHAAPCGPIAMRVMNGGPTAECEALTDALFAALSVAGAQVLIATPYFVPPPDLRRALRAAALRGVEVKILLPAENNHLSVAYASRACYDELLLAGVRLFERRPPFTHAKAIVIDDHVSIFGSANFDQRSLRLNYETNLVAFDRDFAANIKQAMLNEFAGADEVLLADWRRRPSHQRLIENFFNLMSPGL
jgi:cardiolipin synthase